MLPFEQIAEMWSQEIKGQLRRSISSADFNTWIVSLKVCKVIKNTIYLETGNHIGAEIIMERYASVIDDAWANHLGDTVHCEVVAAGRNDNDLINSTEKNFSVNEKTIQIQPNLINDVRDCFIQPDRIVSIPKSLLRWLSYLTPTLASIIVAFRQACYFKNDDDFGKSFSSSLSEISRWAGIDRSTLHRSLSDPRLSWFITRGNSGKIYYDHSRGHPISPESVFKFNRSHLPVPPGDILYLRAALVEAGIKIDPVGALTRLLSAQPNEVIPRLTSVPPKDWENLDPTEWSYENTISVLIGQKLDGVIGSLATQLREHLWPENHVVMMSWYELLNWQKLIGHAPFWMIVFLKTLTYHNYQTGESRVEVKIPIKDLTRVVGISDKSVRRWLKHSVTVDVESLSSSDRLQCQIRIVNQQNLIRQFVKLIDQSRSNPKARIAWTPPLTPEDEVLYESVIKLIKFLDSSPENIRYSLVKYIEDTAGDDLGLDFQHTGHNATSFYPQTGHNATSFYPQTGHDATSFYPQTGHDATSFRDTMRHIKVLNLNTFLRLLNYIRLHYGEPTEDESKKSETNPVVVDLEKNKSNPSTSTIQFDYNTIYSRVTQNDVRGKHKRGTLTQLISLVLYISSPAGETLGPGYIVNRLDAKQGAGFPYELIADWNPEEILNFIKNPPSSYSANDKDRLWSKYFFKNDRIKASQLLYWLSGEMEML